MAIDFLEKDIEDILEKHHSFFIEKELSLLGRQTSFHGKRVDLIFKDRFGDTLVVEIKKGIISRDSVSQILDYLGELALIDEKRIRLMLIGSHVPPNWKIALDRQGIEYREITPRDYLEFLKISDIPFHDKISNQDEKSIHPDTSEPASTIPDPSNTVWKRINDYASSHITSQIPLLNPEVSSSFSITEVHPNHIKIDKLPIKLSEELFSKVYQHIVNQKEWLRIGASRINTKPNTLEGYIKTTFLNGTMNGLSTATWIAAILVYSLDEIIFNKKSRGQAIRYDYDQKSEHDGLLSKYPWALYLMEIGEEFKKRYYPNLTKMSNLPKKGPNVKIQTNQRNVHFEWFIRSKVLEVGLHIENRTNKEWNYLLLDKLKKYCIVDY